MTHQAIATKAVLGALLLTAVAVPAAVAAPAAPTAQRYLVATDSSAVTGGVAVRTSRSGGKVDTVYSKVFSGFSATLTARQVQDLKANDAVTAVVPDGIVHTTAVQSKPTWGLDRSDQRVTTGNKSYRYDTTGAGVTAFVLDTGVRLSHKQFTTRVTSGPDLVDQDTDASDCDGHGTHVAGTVGGSTYGVAKGVKLVSVRVLDCEGSGYWSDIIAGLDWIVAHKPKGPSVINVSIGGGAYPLADQAIARTVAAGIPVVVAAGNEGGNACDTSPARAKSAITVAATDSRDARPEWSNFGSCVDLFAPGVDVRSASAASNTANELMSGTSMSAPHVTGVVARYLQRHPKSTPAQTAAALLGSTTRGTVKDLQGSPNRLLYAAPGSAKSASPMLVALHSSTRRP